MQQELVARQHPVGVGQESRQQVIFHRRERDLVAADLEHAAGFEIDLAAPEPLAPRLLLWLPGRGLPVVFRQRLGLHPAQHALDPGQQLAQIEGLRDVVVGAQLQADHPVDHVAGRGHHDDADLVVLSKIARQHQPVLSGQPDVQQHGIGKLMLDLLAHLRSAGGLGDGEAVSFEVLAQQ